MNYKAILFLSAIIFWGGICKSITVPGSSPYRESYTIRPGAVYVVELDCNNSTTLEVLNQALSGNPVIRKESIINKFIAQRSNSKSFSIMIDIKIISDFGIEVTCNLVVTEDMTQSVMILIAGIVIVILVLCMLILLVVVVVVFLILNYSTYDDDTKRDMNKSPFPPNIILTV